MERSSPVRIRENRGTVFLANFLAQISIGFSKSCDIKLPVVSIQLLSGQFHTSSRMLRQLGKLPLTISCLPSSQESKKSEILSSSSVASWLFLSARHDKKSTATFNPS